MLLQLLRIGLIRHQNHINRLIKRYYLLKFLSDFRLSNGQVLDIIPIETRGIFMKVLHFFIVFLQSREL
jgi:hypothetical protein